MKKKVAYLLIMTFALSMAFTSCKKDPIVPVEPIETLAELYPDWTNLTWVSTDGDSYTDKYPKLNIIVVGDLVSVTKTLFAGDIFGKFTEMEVVGTNTTFSKIYETYNGLGDPLECTNVSVTSTQISLTCLGNDYVLNIN